MHGNESVCGQCRMLCLSHVERERLVFRLSHVKSERRVFFLFHVERERLVFCLPHVEVERLVFRLFDLCRKRTPSVPFIRLV